MLDVARIRRDFPILNQEVNGKPLVYLDSAASAQRPVQVVEALKYYYEHSHANVHRGVHTLGERATSAYEGARERVARFIGAKSARGVIFTRGTTEALNLVAYAWGLHNLGPGDVVLTTVMEHHSNLVPWQQAARIKGAALRFIPLNPDGTLDLTNLEELLKDVKVVAITLASNVLGTIVDIPFIARKAKEVGAIVVVDGAQGVPHMRVNVSEWGIDFLAFSGHKMLGPTGIGVLWGRPSLLEKMEPFQFGGSMIGTVSCWDATWAEVPARFEAGTPNIAGAVGLAAAMDYLEGIGLEAIEAHEHELTTYALEQLGNLEGITIYGPLGKRTGLVSFYLDDIHPHDISTVLDSEGVAIRAGHHCAQPLMEWLQAPATNRASWYVYNDRTDIDRLVAALVKAKEFFGHAVV